MGEAKRRGRFEVRKAQSLEKQAEAEALRLAERDKVKQRVILADEGSNRYSRIERAAFISAIAILSSANQQPTGQEK